MNLRPGNDLAGNQFRLWIADAAAVGSNPNQGLIQKRVDAILGVVAAEVFAAYGYTGNDDPKCVPSGKRHCEIDHLISRELGGADDVNNLWPQAFGTTPWNAQLKDNLENKLNKEMCAGRITLKQARDMLVNDWRIAYKKYYGTP